MEIYTKSLTFLSRKISRKFYQTPFNKWKIIGFFVVVFLLFYFLYFFFLFYCFKWHIMKRKFKQWWSTIPPISTKQTITSHLNWTELTEHKKTMSMEMQVMAFNRHNWINNYLETGVYGVLCEVLTYTVTVSYRCETWIRYQKS